jgi:thiol-disulfide isomerase/thioredoxin
LETGSDIKPSKSWALPLVVALIVMGAAAAVYVLFAATSKPVQAGYAHFAKGALHRLVVLDDAPPQPVQPLTDGDGHTTTLSAYRSQIVLVNLWATWCGPCVQEMPTLGALERRFGGRGFHVVPVSIDGVADAAKAKTELARLSQGALPFLNDPSRGIAFAAHADAMPTSILYDAQGRELARVVGDADWTSPEANAFITHALGQR